MSNQKNYITPAGFAALQQELRGWLEDERPRLVETVRWAASNGDRSENADYIYGKRRLREIDRRIRYLTQQIDRAQVVDPKDQQDLKQVFFGALVTYQVIDPIEEAPKTVHIVGVDEANIRDNKISWVSPLARSLWKASVDDERVLNTPSGEQHLVVLEIRYPCG